MQISRVRYSHKRLVCAPVRETSLYISELFDDDYVGRFIIP